MLGMVTGSIVGGYLPAQLGFDGMMISLLVNRNLLAGEHQVVWKPGLQEQCKPGVYLVKFTTSSGIRTRKILLMK